MGAEQEEAFRHWWNRNHPLDWFASERDGKPMSHQDRLFVWDLCRKAFLREERTADRVSAGLQNERE